MRASIDASRICDRPLRFGRWLLCLFTEDSTGPMADAAITIYAISLKGQVNDESISPGGASNHAPLTNDSPTLLLYIACGFLDRSLLVCCWRFVNRAKTNDPVYALDSLIIVGGQHGAGVLPLSHMPCCSPQDC